MQIFVLLRMIRKTQKNWNLHVSNSIRKRTAMSFVVFNLWNTINWALRKRLSQFIVFQFPTDAAPVSLETIPTIFFLYRLIAPTRRVSGNVTGNVSGWKFESRICIDLVAVEVLCEDRFSPQKRHLPFLCT